jgi:hypothetical protein
MANRAAINTACGCRAIANEQRENNDMSAAAALDLR